MSSAIVPRSGGGAWDLAIRALLALACISACRNEHKDEPKVAASDAKPRLADMFAAKLAKATGASANGDMVKISAHSLSLTTDIEQTQTAPDGRVVVGVKVSCKLDGTPAEALTAGSIGIDSSRDAALVTAAEEWALQYGKPIVDALSATPPALQSGGFKVYAGPTGIRGSKPDDLAEINSSFFRTVEPALPTLIPSKSGLHTMTITAVRNKDGSVEGEFRVDGQVSEQLKQLALQVKWPASSGGYMLKQYYVLRAD